MGLFTGNSAVSNKVWWASNNAPYTCKLKNMDKFKYPQIITKKLTHA
jgi:hypothetical protein